MIVGSNREGGTAENGIIDQGNNNISLTSKSPLNLKV